MYCVKMCIRDRYVAILSGLVAGVLIGKATEYYTSDTFKPTQELSSKSQTGAATIIIGGLGLGMLSTAVPIIIVAVCILLEMCIRDSSHPAYSRSSPRRT